MSATQGTTFTKTYNNTATAHWGITTDWRLAIGAKTAKVDALGVLSTGFVSLMLMGERWNATFNGNYTGNRSWTNTQTIRNTLTQTVSTTPGLTGAAGDVFVGQATNEVFSNSRMVNIMRDPNDSTRYYIGDYDGFVFGKTFGTQFTYTQNHIETKLLPDYRRMRNALLQHADSVSVVRYRTGKDTMVFVNNTSKPQYYTWLSEDDPRYGVDTATYVMVSPKPNPEQKVQVYKNMVQYYNEQVRQWKQLLAHNEEMKVMCQQRNGAFKQEQYDKAVEKVDRLREVMSALYDARAKMAAVAQYDIDLSKPTKTIRKKRKNNLIFSNQRNWIP